MKIINLLLAFQLLLLDIYSGENILSKFHQNGFKIKDERVQLIRYNKSYFDYFEIKAFKYNRTTTAHNISFMLKLDVQDKCEVLVQGYKFLSNEYRYFPLRFQVNLKKGYDSNIIGLGRAKNCGYTNDFYFYKNVAYSICNFVIDEKRFPPLIPDGKYRIEVAYLYYNKEISMFYIFCEVYVPIPYPKHKN